MSEYSIGNLTFNSKAEAKQHIKDILNKDRFGNILNDYEEETIINLFYTRDKNIPKIKHSNIKFVYIRDNGKGSKEFVIKSFTGEDICFSYLKCFNEKTLKGKFSAACRNAILAHKPYCPKGYERHHAGRSMSEIIDLFIDEYNIILSEVEYIDKDFKDTNLKVKFYEFHDELAEYCILSHEEHMKLHKRTAENK